MRISKQTTTFFGVTGGLRINNQDVVDALRNTVTVILPIALFFYLGMPSTALGIGSGALLICLTDLPGSRSEKLFGAWTSILTFFAVATIIALAIQNLLVLPIIAAMLTFVLVIAAALGQRIGAIGMMGLALIAFTIGLRPVHALEYGCLIALGGMWYFLVSLVQAWIFPHHSLRRALAKTSRDTAALMRLRASGYDQEATLAGFNAKNIKLHLKITADHEQVRRLLLGDRFNVKFESETAKRLLRQAVILIDLYEQVSALHHDYQGIRKALRHSGVLELIKDAICTMADQLDGLDCHRAQFEQMISKIENITSQSEHNLPLMNGIVSNLRQTGALAFSLDDVTNLDTHMDVDQFPEFLTEGKISLANVKPHLSYGSHIFRFALRLSILMLVVVGLIGLLPKDSYGYWLPLTLIVISRPSYGMTMKRNMERILGTFVGLSSGWCLLEFDWGQSIQLGIAIICLFVFFTFLSIRYWISAMGITLAVVLCLSVYHGHAEQILSERLLFTMLGCLIGMAATFLFPIRHALSLKTSIGNAIRTNMEYLSSAIDLPQRDVTTVKLARKKSYLSLSALNEAIFLASKEPKWKRKELRALKQIELFCFQVNALTAALPLADVVGQAHHIQVIKAEILPNLGYCIQQINMMDNVKLFNIQPLERLDGQLDLSNVVGKLRSIFSNGQTQS